MKIQEHAHVSMDYTLALDSGDVVDQSEPGQPLEFIFNTGYILPSLEERLLGLSAGDTVQVVIEAVDGYGEPDESLLQKIPRKRFPPDLELEVGMTMEAEGPHGDLPFVVREITADTVTVDFNHPLAGERLHFDVKITAVREATEEEIEEALADDDCDSDDCGGCGGSCH